MRQKQDQRVGVLLVNLGTPDSADPKDVKRYLLEFLTDPRVIDKPWLLRHLLIRGVIVPTRYKFSSAAYKQIWSESGSPLLVYSMSVKEKLQEALGEQVVVEIAMRYQNPSIKSGIESLISADVDRIVVFPLFPQYASATTGSIHQKVMEVIKGYEVIPDIRLMNGFYESSHFLDAFASIAGEYDWENYDHILFSFHGLPENQVLKADPYKRCLQSKNCCEENRNCYAAQCMFTAKAIAKRLNMPSDRYTICFQSRLGKEPWLKPYASDVIESLAHEGVKNLLALCPSFVCDCLETIFEYGIEYQKEFQAQGGKRLDLVRGLNDDPRWILSLKEMILETIPESCKINQSAL